MLTGNENPGVRKVIVGRAAAGRISPAVPDDVAVEEPLEIQIGFTNGARQTRTVAITMRTPGHDRELAAGFLYAERIVSRPSDVATVLLHRNIARVELDPSVKIDWELLERRSYMSSSCGVCGKTSLGGLRESRVQLDGGMLIPARVLTELPTRLRAVQSVFKCTGGLHAAALFHSGGEFTGACEDVGRHNALDKLIGSHFLRDALPLPGRVLLLSGRASFELIHKAAAAGIPVVAAVGAPSSLAIDTAEDAGITLVGFVRNGGFNIYCGAHRVVEDR